MKIKKNNILRGGLMLALAGTMVGCSDGFLEQDPLSFYEPATTYSTEAGLQACRDGFTEQWVDYCEEYGYQ